MLKLELLISILEQAFGHPVERGKELEEMVVFINNNYPEFWPRAESGNDDARKLVLDMFIACVQIRRQTDSFVTFLSQKVGN